LDEIDIALKIHIPLKTWRKAKGMKLVYGLTQEDVRGLVEKAIARYAPGARVTVGMWPGSIYDEGQKKP